MVVLNREQTKAVHSLDGPLIIRAGAGSGKTRVLAERFVEAVAPSDGTGRDGVPVHSILAITFTDKSAGELQERIRTELRRRGLEAEARAVDSAWISTIHGMCARLLRRYALVAGVDPSFTVCDSVQAGSLRERAFEAAATAAIASHDQGARLFGDYGFDEVYRSVVGASNALRARGWDASRLVPEAAPDPRALLDKAQHLFGQLVEDLKSCGSSSSKTVNRHMDACGECLGDLATVGSANLDGAELAEELWRCLEPYSVPGRAPAAAAELLSEFAGQRAMLTQEAAAAAAAPMLQAWSQLVADYMSRYQKLKDESVLLDFDDLQSRTAALIEDPRVAAEIAQRFRLVMVDEFQDTDALQLRLLSRLAGENLCTVGDERQSIYRFRGADVAVYRSHVEEMRERDAEEVALATNYRSHPEILEFANRTFGSPAIFGDGLVRLRPGRQEPVGPLLEGYPRVEMVVASKTGQAEAGCRRAVAHHVARRFADLRDRGFDSGDMVVLLRTYLHADEYAKALRAAGLPAIVIGGNRFFGLPETEMMRALCRAVANPSDDEAVGLLLTSDLTGLSDDAMLRLASAVRSGAAGTLWEAAHARDGLVPSDAEDLERTRRAISKARERLGREPLATVLLRAIEEVDLDLRLLSRGDEGRESYANVLKFVRLAEAYEARGGAGAAGFVAHLRDKERYGDHEAPATLADDRTPAVRIMSIHASKGLEFPVVAVPEVSSGGRASASICVFEPQADGLQVALKLPSDWCTTKAKLDRTLQFEQMRRSLADAEAEESHRLLYVAATRAKEVLILGDWRNTDGPDERDDLGGKLSEALGLSEALEMGERLHVLGGDGDGGLTIRLSVVEAFEAEEERGTAAVTQTGAGGAVKGRIGEQREPEHGGGGKVPDRTPSHAAADPGQGAAAFPAGPPRLSYSGLAAYERCGLRFYARSVLGVGGFRMKAGASQADLGSAVHAALEVAADGPLPEQRREAIASYFRLDERQRQALDQAVASYLASPVAQRVRSLPSVRREVPFALSLGEGATGFVLDGTIDVYGADGKAALIVDYKTGTSGTEEELRERYVLQARCYALAALRDGRNEVEVVFVRPQVLVDGRPQEVAFRFGPEDAEDIERQVLEMHRRMAAGEYHPLPEWQDQLCSDCAIAFGLCPVRPRAAG